MASLNIAASAKRSAERPGRLRMTLLAATALAAGMFAATGAQASGTISIGKDKSISVGLGMRGSYTYDEHGSAVGGSSSKFRLDSVRLYVNGQVTSWLKATFNTERDGDGHIDVLDGYVQIEPTEGFNVWVGRMLPPSDRANLDGPYYLNTWNYPGVVSQYPAKFAGRDNGATIWGKLFKKKLVYSVGVFEGHNRIAGASNQSDNMLFAGRVAYNILDPEPDPAYYESSTYYGSANILTVAFAAQYQHDGVGTAALKGNYFAWNFDVLFEKKLESAGTVTLEGAYYNYDTGGVFDVATGFGGAGATANVGGITEGKAYLLGADYMFPEKVGVGYVQPAFRYQEFDARLTSAVTRQYDFGINYIIDGHNARISADYAKVMNSASSDNLFVLGVQLQI